ncbi:MAG: hypothetical protein AAFR66_25215 [Bacteroidota bacterium]
MISTQKVLVLLVISLFSVILSCQPLPQEQTSVPVVNVSSPENIRKPLLISSDFGRSWQNVSGNLPDDIQASFLELKGEEIVIATDNLGLWLSSENKTTWKEIGQGLPAKKINALYVSGEEIYVGVYREGIYRSSDEGQTWTSLNFDLPNLSVQVVHVYQNNIFVGTDLGIYQLNTEERYWEAAIIGPQVLSIYDYQDKLIAGTSQGSLLSSDGGKSWKWIRQEGSVHYTHNIDQRIYELMINGDLMYSDDWGESWSDTYYQPRQSYVYEIVQAGDHLVMSNNYGIHHSKNDGLSWELVYPTEEMAFFDFLVIGEQIYGGTRAWDEYRKRN